jgi:hypothetical protein
MWRRMREDALPHATAQSPNHAIRSCIIILLQADAFASVAL